MAKFNSQLYKEVVKHYKNCSENEIYLLLRYLNQYPFIKQLREENGFNVEQINDLFNILVKRAVDIGEQLPDGYINLYDLAEEKGWIQ